MKACPDCIAELEIGTTEQCEKCRKKAVQNAKARQRRRAIKEAYESCGLKRVRGALGGIYYE
jgi:hypothetical protein